MIELTAIDYHAPDAAEHFVQSLKQTGFGVLKNHPLSQASVQHLYQQWQTFFDAEHKNDFEFTQPKQDGFFSTTKAETAKGAQYQDLKEYFHYYPWGQCPAYLKQMTQSYFEQANQLAQTLLTWVEAYTPETIAKHYSQPLSGMIQNSENTLLRILHYPPLPKGQLAGAIRAAAHEDINLLTVLPAANEPGLQVKTLTGGWLDVPSDFGYLIINTGDMLQEASNGYFPSTTHRVINPTGAGQTQSRISMPLFLHARPDVKLSERHTAQTYLMERLKELGVLS